MENLLKSNCFIKYKKIIFSNSIDKDKSIEISNKYILENNNKEIIKKKIINKNTELNKEYLNYQDFILNILIELRNFDELNGTNLFKKISYNDLNTFILKNTV